jgi:hypothetical protein
MRGWIAAWKADMYISVLRRHHDGSNSQGVSFPWPLYWYRLSLVVARSVVGQVDCSRNVAKSDLRQSVIAIIVFWK